MFGFGFGEFLVLGAIVIVLVFARRIPDVVRALGKSTKAFKAGLEDGEEARKSRDVTPVSKD